MAAETQNAAASSSTFEEEVKKLMGKGKVHLVCNENFEAVKCFEEATKKLDEKYGQDLADECGEAYYYYGKSLLEVARMEGDVLGKALEGAIENEAQENGDGEASSTDKKTDEDNKDKDGKTTKDEEKKDEGLIVGPDIDEIDEEEKEKIGMDVTNAMTEEAFKQALEEDKEKNKKPDEKEDKTPEETKEAEKITTEKKDEKPEASKPEEKGETSEERKEGEGKEESAEATEKSMAEKKDEKPEESKPGEKDADEKKEGEGKEGEDKEGEEEGEDDEPMEAEGAENAEAEQTEEDDPTYMELAWQMLEGARLIFQKRESKEGKLMLAQCHLKLGEIQMEQEQFLSAIEDFLKCLDIQKEHLEPDNRLLAETAYNIGLAFSFQSMHDKSKDYYSQALQTIDLRIKNLQNSIEEAESKSKGKDKATDDNPFVANRKELQELQELYPEIKAKVDDASEMMKQEVKKPDVSTIMGNGSSTTIGFGNSSNKDAPAATMIATKKAPVAATDISHLVHRNKRKPEEASNGDTVAKKPRQDTDTAEANDKPAETTNGKTETTMEATPAES